MTITINGTTGITTPEITLDNTAADGAQLQLASSGYSNWNIDNYSGRLRGYYGSTEYWTVDASGNMGIGTSSPATILTGSLSSSSTGLAIAGGVPTLALYDSSGTTGTGFIGQINTNTYFFNKESGSLILGTGNTERARIDSSGNLLVGTTSQINGDKVGVTFDGLTQNGIVFKTTYGSIGSVFAQFRTTSAAIGNITQNGASTVSYATSSDYRLKENIAPMTGALSIVSQLNPVTYNWRSDGSDGQGFIAHELQAIVPDAVTGEKDAVDADGNPVYQGIDTSFLVATLTAAIQELKAIVDEQAAKITALENK